MKVPKKVQKTGKVPSKDFKLKQFAIRLTKIESMHRVVLLKDLKHLPPPKVTIKNDLGTATTSENEDDENAQNVHLVQTAIGHEPGYFDENDHYEVKSVNVTKADELLICNLCSETFIGRSAVENHVTNCYNSDLIFVCTICDECFKNEEDQEEHSRVHEKVYPFACTKCRITFDNAFELKVHNAIKHAERKWKKSNFVKERNNFVCSTCELSYRKRSELIKHIMKLHTRRLAFACKKCELSFSKECCLKKHSKKHKHKKYVCSICSCCFQDKAALGDHVSVHIGEKIFKCSACGRGFRSLKTLKRHVFAHTGETPFKCSECEASYTRKFILIEHMQQILCPVCREVFHCKTKFDEHGENCF